MITAPILRWHWVGICIVLCLVHYPIGESFVWDDELLIELNPWTRDWNGIWFAWTHHLWQDIPGEHLTHWYRPLMGTHLVLDQQLFQSSILQRQWINLFWLLCATGLLVDWTMLRFKLSHPTAIVMGLLLASSHLNTELIHFTAARNDTMALTFAVLAAISQLKGRSRWLIAFYGLLSLCSKESGLILLTGFSLLSTPFKIRNWAITLGIPVMIWAILRFTIIQDTSTPSLHIQWTELIPNALSVPFYWIQIDPSALTRLNAHPMWPITGLLMVALLSFFRSTSNTVGISILFASFLYTVLVNNQSIFGGFRYQYLSYAFAIALYCLNAKSPIMRVVALVIVCFNLSNSWSTKMQWSSNHSFWEFGYSNTPTTHIACGSFMHLRENPTLAVERLSVALDSPVMMHCCAQATRYPIEINDPALAIEMGLKAQKNGCPLIPELTAPLALAYALQQQWDTSAQVISMIESDPFGYKPIIETAIGLQSNNLGPLEHWAIQSQQQFPEMSLEAIKHEIQTRAESLIAQSHPH